MKKKSLFNKYLGLCWHGLTVVYEPGKYITAMSSTLCNHNPWGIKQLKTEDVIAWVETIKQPKWAKTWKIGKFHIAILKQKGCKCQV